MNVYSKLPSTSFSFNDVATDDAVSNDKFNGMLQQGLGAMDELMRASQFLRAEALGLPAEIHSRMPFPGPALAARVIGEATPERIATVPDVRAWFVNERGERELSFSLLSRDQPPTASTGYSASIWKKTFPHRAAPSASRVVTRAST